MWNNIGAVFTIIAVFASAFAMWTFIWSLLPNRRSMRAVSKRAAILAAIAFVIGILIMKLLATSSETPEATQKALEFTNSLSQKR